MCGIFGVVDFSKRIDLLSFSEALNTLEHRGPDSGNGEFFEEEAFNLFLGHRRLSIIDLNAGANQPMYNQSRSKVIIFNGEIYNYLELRKELIDLGYSFLSSSDTEVILASFEEWGENCLNRFIGMFAFVIYDKDLNEIFVARDRVGVKPLFIAEFNNCISFSSELKPLVGLAGFDKTISKRALTDYFRLGYVPAPLSIYSCVRKMVPGSYLKYNLHSRVLNESVYWDVNSYFKRPKLSIDYFEAKGVLKDVIFSACEYRMVSDVPVGVFLSGGYDSSLVTAVLQKSATSPIHTFSVGFEDPNYDESSFSSAVAGYLGTNHTEYICSELEAQSIIPELPFYYDEPFGDSSAIPTILVSRLAKKRVDVALSADGGDELFAGYNKYSNALKAHSLKSKVPRFLRPLIGKSIEVAPAFMLEKLSGKKPNRDISMKFSNIFTSDLSELEFMQLISTSSMKHNSIFNESVLLDSIDKSAFGRLSDLDGIEKLDQLLALDFKTYLPDDILTKVDRATMSVSLEGREPLLDHRLIELACQLPTDFKMRDGKKKLILKDIVHDYIPKEIMDRPKMGFGIPVVDWMRQDLADLFCSYITRDKLQVTGFFNEDEILSMLKSYLKGDNSQFTLLWYIFTFLMWYDKWK